MHVASIEEEFQTSQQLLSNFILRNREEPSLPWGTRGSLEEEVEKEEKDEEEEEVEEEKGQWRHQVESKLEKE